MASPRKTSSTRKKPAKRMPAAERRQQILDSVHDLVYEQRSFENLSMESIARAAGVTKPVVYDLFPNRAAILKSLIEREREFAFQEVFNMLPKDVWSEIDPDDLLTSVIEQFFNSVKSNPKRWLLMLHPVEGTPHDAREHILQIREEVAALVDGLVQVGLAIRGTAEPVDTMLLSRMVVGMVEDTARLVLEEPDAYSPERVIAFVGWMASLVPRSNEYPVSAANQASALSPVN